MNINWLENPSGVLLINKPANITSQKCLKLVQNKLQIKKIGHTGSLDPFAEGILIGLVNSSTKLSNFLMSSQKEYLVEMLCNIKTDTADITGKVIKFENKKLNDINNHQINKVFRKFVYNEYYQTPPIYSAIKIKGKRLYQYARNNEKIEIKKRLIKIFKLKLIKNNLNNNNTIKFKVICSKGTYIRSLVEDIAKSLGLIATTKTLIRIKNGNLNIKNSKTPIKINLDNLRSPIKILRQNNYQLRSVNKKNKLKINYGQNISLSRWKFIKKIKPIFLYYKKQLIAVYIWNKKINKYKIIRGLQ